MVKVAAPDRYTLVQRPNDGVGPDEVIGRFGNPDDAYAELLRQIEGAPDLFGGLSPVRRLLTKDAES